ncbi:MAG: MFS transporter, partial [Aquincola sp.]|nr:MFS transporter [Aquincola sp.]
RQALTALATLGAGPLLQALGWASLNAATLPLLVLAAGLTGWWVLAERRGAGHGAAASAT